MQLPFKQEEKLDRFGLSKEHARKRFLTPERKLLKDESLRRHYVQFMDEYITLRHIRIIEDSGYDMAEPSFYLPHHAVLKESSLTTKLRVVFDGSSKSTTGIALNDLSQDEIPEVRKICVNLTVTSAKIINIEHFSSFSRLIRVTSYCIRFIENFKRTQHERQYSGLSSNELNRATRMLAKLVQEAAFHQELLDVRNGRPIHARSKLLCLSPFLNDEGIIRVGGRLKNAMLPYSTKHPIVLPASNHFTKLVIRYEHIKQLHAGVEGTFAAIRSKFWIITARNSVRQVVRNCVNCFRTKLAIATQIMGNLPKARVQLSKPFQVCGIDYFGPLMIKQGNRKN